MTEIKFQSTMDVEYLDNMGTDEDVARAARVSTGLDQADQGSISGLIGYLVSEGHTSTLEHCFLKVWVHVPIFVHRQLMTHRTISKNSESGRYTELKPLFWVPSVSRPLVNRGTSARPDLSSGDFKSSLAEIEAHKDLARSGWLMYQESLERGTAKEVARDYLPVTTYTSMYMSGNLLAWINFLTLRNGNHGHPQHEIVQVAQQIEALFAEFYPVVYAAWAKYNRIQAILQEQYYQPALELWKKEQESK